MTPNKPEVREMTDEQIRDIENDQAKMPGTTRENLTVRTVRAALIAQHGFCCDEDQCTCAREIGYRVCQPSPGAPAQTADVRDAMIEECAKVCEGGLISPHPFDTGEDEAYNDGIRNCAKYIRALQSGQKAEGSGNG